MEVICARATNAVDETPSRRCRVQSKTFRALRCIRTRGVVVTGGGEQSRRTIVQHSHFAPTPPREQWRHDGQAREKGVAVDAIGRTLECTASTGGCIGGSWQRENSNNVVGPVSPPSRAQSPRCTRVHRIQSRRPSGSGWRIVVSESPQVTPRGCSRTVWFDW